MNSYRSAQTLQYDLNEIIDSDCAERVEGERGALLTMRRVKDPSRTSYIAFECEFMRMKPSTIATACIVSALKGLKAQLDYDTFKHICMLTSSPIECVEHAVTMLEWIVAKESASAIIPASTGKMTPCSGAGAGVEKMQTVNTDEEKPETPTDVQDVKF